MHREAHIDNFMIAMRAVKRISAEEKDREALRAFHVLPNAHVVVVLRNGHSLYVSLIGEVFQAVPDEWQEGMKVYTPSYVLGDGTWWKWIRALYGGRVPRGFNVSEGE